VQGNPKTNQQGAREQRGREREERAMKQDREGEKGKKGEQKESRLDREVQQETTGQPAGQRNRDREPAREILKGEKEGEGAEHKHRQKTGGTGKGKQKEKERKKKIHSSVGERRIQGTARDAEEGRQGPEGPPLTAALALRAPGRLCRFRRFSVLLSSIPLP